MNNKIKIKIYGDNTLEIIPHPYYHNPNKNTLIPKNPNRESSFIESSFMNSKEYSLLLKRTYRKLFTSQLCLNNAFFITLTLKEIISIKQLNKEFHKFIVYTRRKISKPEYFRAFEFHNKGNRLHVHVLLSFNQQPTNLTKEFIEKNLWKLGAVDIKKSWSTMGALEYCTTYKRNNIQNDKNKGYTYFPKGTKIISMSENFIVKNKDYEEFEIDKSTFHNFLSQREEIEINGGFMRIDKHSYFNNYYQEVKECIDRVFVIFK